MAQHVAAFGRYCRWFGDTGNIPLVATTMLPRIFLQQTTIKPHITNLPVETANNENQDTLAAMAKLTATLGLPGLPIAGVSSFSAVPTNVKDRLKGKGQRSKVKGQRSKGEGRRVKGEGRKTKSDELDLPKL
jgi:hypothetical protein